MLFEIVASFCFLFADDSARLDMAKNLSREKAYQESSAVLSLVNPGKVDQSTYYFYKLLNEYGTNQKEKGLKTYRTFEMLDQDTIPDRYLVLAYLMHKDMLTWKKDDLDDIRRDMQHVKDRLEHAKGGKQTQGIQDEIVRKLDKLIKQAEDEKNKQQQQASNQQQKGQENRPESPMPDSQIGTDRGPGAIDPKKYHDNSKAWGALPEKERTKAMMRKVQEMPAQHRKMIEDYFKKSAIEGGKK